MPQNTSTLTSDTSDTQSNAKANDFTIVTFDTDFFDISLLKGTPPKVDWLSMGNTTTNNLAICLEKNIELIKQFIENTEYRDLACLEMDE
jgi:predicted nuclease of predicted toxin-antitoxin system